MTVDKKSWGYRRNTVLSDFLTMDNLTSILASSVRLDTDPIQKWRPIYCSFLLMRISLPTCSLILEQKFF